MSGHETPNRLLQTGHVSFLLLLPAGTDSTGRCPDSTEAWFPRNPGCPQLLEAFSASQWHIQEDTQKSICLGVFLLFNRHSSGTPISHTPCGAPGCREKQVLLHSPRGGPRGGDGEAAHGHAAWEKRTEGPARPCKRTHEDRKSVQGPQKPAGVTREATCEP